MQYDERDALDSRYAKLRSFHSLPPYDELAPYGSLLRASLRSTEELALFKSILGAGEEHAVLERMFRRRARFCLKLALDRSRLGSCLHFHSVPGTLWSFMNTVRLGQVAHPTCPNPREGRAVSGTMVGHGARRRRDGSAGGLHKGPQRTLN